MSSIRNRAKSIFQELIDLPADCRHSALDEFGVDEEVRAEVIRLLEFHDDDSSYLLNPLAHPSAEDGPPTPDTFISSGTSSPSGNPNEIRGQIEQKYLGQTVGDFKLLSRLGYGGMGVVFLAEQQRPHRKAAVKFLQPHHASDIRALQRFELESELLARLKHPGIAEVFAAGTANLGFGEQRWFAMEYVEGVSLSSYIETRQPGLRQKLELIILICDAISHAHARGITHRDLKPSNILVTQQQESTWSVKIVDFGVASSREATGLETRVTAQGDVIGTLNYMSPEQVAGTLDGVDHRADIYALGVIMFEMLCGKLPFERDSSSLLGALQQVKSGKARRIRDVRPETPRDLSIIVDKSMAADSDQRYDSAIELGTDLQNFLTRRPITARRPSWNYLLSKFIARHWLATGMVTALILGLSVGLAAYARQAGLANRAAQAAINEARKTRYEADKAQAINNFITNDFLTRLLASGSLPAGSTQDRIGLVRHASDRIDLMFGERPTIEAAVRNEIGTIYYNLGSIGEAADQYNQALSLWESELGAEHPDTLKALNNLGQAQLVMGRREQAESNLRKALAGRTKHLGRSHPLTLTTMNNLAQLLSQSGTMTAESEQLFQQVISHGLGNSAAADKAVLTAMANFGSIQARNGNLQAALKLHREVFNSASTKYGAGNITTINAGFSLGNTYYKLKQYGDAVEVLKELPDKSSNISGPTGGITISLRRLLARCFRELGEAEQARSQLQILEKNLIEIPESTERNKNLERVRRDLSRLAN